MVKGIWIMLLVFLVVGIIGWAVQLINKAPEVKKKKYRKNFLIFYGLFLIIQGTVTLYNSDEFDFFSTVQLLLGIVLVGVVTLGKHQQIFKSES